MRTVRSDHFEEHYPVFWLEDWLEMLPPNPDHHPLA